MVAQAILDAQGNRPTYANFARPPAENPFDDPLLAVLRRAAAAATATQLEPRSFFVAWSGVLVLAYDGFTPPLASVKRTLNESELPLCRESFGSKWPKTTLGAVADDAPPLTAAQLAALKALCLRHSQNFTGCAARARRLARELRLARARAAHGARRLRDGRGGRDARAAHRRGALAGERCARRVV